MEGLKVNLVICILSLLTSGATRAYNPVGDCAALSMPVRFQQRHKRKLISNI